MSDSSKKTDNIFSVAAEFDQPPLFDIDSESAGPKSLGHSQQQVINNDFDDFDSFRGSQSQQLKNLGHQDEVDPFGIDGRFNNGGLGPKPLSADLLGDFIEKERGGLPTPPKFDVQAEINTTFNGDTKGIPDDAADDDFGHIQPDYLNPYATKLESNEKFISTDDLIGLSDNESNKPEKEHAFEDCKETEAVAVKPPVVTKEEPKVEPKKSDPPKANELLEAEKLFIRFGLGKFHLLLFHLLRSSHFHASHLIELVSAGDEVIPTP